MLFNVELENARATEVCLDAVEAGDYPLITKALDQYQPDEQDIRLLVVRAIQVGDMQAIQAIAKSEVNHLKHFKAPLMTMWLISNGDMDPSQWEPLMKWVTTDDIRAYSQVTL